MCKVWYGIRKRGGERGRDHKWIMRIKKNSDGACEETYSLLSKKERNDEKSNHKGNQKSTAGGRGVTDIPTP